MDRVFLHVDMDAFFASVEQHDHPELRGKPVIVGSPPGERGVVAAASYEVRKFGVYSAMPSNEAARRCPQAIFVKSNMKRYKEVSRQIFEIFERFTPLVEPLSVDEAFLDVTGSESLFGSGVEIGEKIRKAIKEETGLTASVGVAPNKFLAKLASDMDKPDGLTLVPFSEDAIIGFLAPLPVGRVWGVGSVTQKHLNQAGIETVGDLQKTDLRTLVGLVGLHSADHLKRLAYGRDSREIGGKVKDRSISKESTFARDISDRNRLENVLLNLIDNVGSQLRASGKYAGVIRLKLRWQGFKTISRQRRLNPPCCDAFTLRNAAVALLRKEQILQPVRLIGIGVSSLCDRQVEQLSLFDDIGDNRDKKEKLSHSVDALKKKFGNDSVGRPEAGLKSTGVPPVVCPDEA
jgi:DNA polymerase-4